MGGAGVTELGSPGGQGSARSRPQSVHRRQWRRVCVAVQQGGEEGAGALRRATPPFPPRVHLPPSALPPLHGTRRQLPPRWPSGGDHIERGRAMECGKTRGGGRRAAWCGRASAVAVRGGKTGGSAAAHKVAAWTPQRRPGTRVLPDGRRGEGEGGGGREGEPSRDEEGSRYSRQCAPPEAAGAHIVATAAGGWRTACHPLPPPSAPQGAPPALGRRSPRRARP